MRTRRITEYLIRLLDMSLSGVLMFLFYWYLPKNIWIISERENQAQDNGIAFFGYLNKFHPEISSFYLLESGDKNIEKVEQVGNVLIKGSRKHKLYFLKSKVIATTEKNIIEPWGSNVFYKYFARFYPKKLRIFLQHGILDKDVSAVYGKSVSCFDLFVTSAEREREFVIKQFGYLPDEVINVGLPRYDQLYIENSTSKEKLILFMPTWRRYLNDLAIKDREYIDRASTKFVSSKYYQVIDDLMSSKQLDKILQEYGYKMIMVTHHGMNDFKRYFKVNSHQVDIYSSEEVEIKALINRATIFITDYSSIHFDSAYVGNINLYYQFDKEDFIKGHASTSYFDYEEDGFGKVIYDRKDLLAGIKKAIQQNGQRENIYTQRVNRFFSFKDNKNCERLYQRINEKLVELEVKN